MEDAVLTELKPELSPLEPRDDLEALGINGLYPARESRLAA